MTTKQAALLAAVGTAIQVVTPLIPFLRGATHGSSFNADLFLQVLWMFLFGVIFLGPIPVFFVFAYLDEPPLAIPGRLRRPALVAAIAAALSAAYTAFTLIQNVIGPWNMADKALMRASHPFQWLLLWPLSGLISVLCAVSVPLFFFTAARSSAKLRCVRPRLKKAAMYAGIVSIVGAASTTWGGVYTYIFYSHQASLAAHANASSVMLWFTIRQISLSLFYNGSLAWFFFLFYRTVTTTQSNQRLSIGE